MMLMCIKQHLSTIWSSIYDKVKQGVYLGAVESMTPEFVDLKNQFLL